MRRLILAVLLAIVQTAAPVPRQAIENHTQKASTKAQVAKDGQQTPATQPLGAPVKVPTGEDSASKTASNQAEGTSPSAKKDESWSRADELSLVYDILTGLLVVIGGFGVCFALRTLRAIEGQTIESTKATKAMERSTEAFVHSQRPIIACDPHHDSGDGWHPILDLINNNRMRLDLFNRGETNAFHCHSETWIELVPHAPRASFSGLEDFTFTDKAVYFAPKHAFRIYPNHGPVVINIPVGRDLSAAEHSALKGARLLVCVRLRVTYRDAFLFPNDPDRFSDFGFWVMLESLGTLTKYQDSN